MFIKQTNYALEVEVQDENIDVTTAYSHEQSARHLPAIVTGNVIQVIFAEQNRD